MKKRYVLLIEVKEEDTIAVQPKNIQNGTAALIMRLDTEVLRLILNTGMDDKDMVIIKVENTVQVKENDSFDPSPLIQRGFLL